eukprot:TRINITY_DN3881_c0_g1_i1.p1 TRINITY_DN3881_c0_g1~~TRINITY_DN3881_c0_g1_i1.p1  ORF type:complete len:430 (+),score=37.60 TRINITY_DN3881_c0_g1_i1:107-1396(+)
MEATALRLMQTAAAPASRLAAVNLKNLRTHSVSMSASQPRAHHPSQRVLQLSQRIASHSRASRNIASHATTSDSSATSSSPAAFQDVDLEQEAAEEDVGEVEKILGSRVVMVTEEDSDSDDEEGGNSSRTRRAIDPRPVTQYLIEWKDDHPDSWEPRENVAADLVAGFEEPWWTAARKGDEAALVKLLEDGRDVNAIDTNGRTALLFAAGLGNEQLVRTLLAAGADVSWGDNVGYTALHIAAGYVHSTVVRALLDNGADPEQEDKQQRSALVLAEQLLKSTPANNPVAFARRLALDAVVKMLDEAVYEEAEVDQVLDKRVGSDGVAEYLVKWSDDSENSWEPAENIGEDLVRDFEEGLEYGVAEKILEKRVAGEKQGGGAGQVEYLVKWVDSDENTWEPEGNVAPEVIAEFEGISVEEVEARLEKVGAK